MQALRILSVVGILAGAMSAQAQVTKYVRYSHQGSIGREEKNRESNEWVLKTSHRSLLLTQVALHVGAVSSRRGEVSCNESEYVSVWREPCVDGDRRWRHPSADPSDRATVPFRHEGTKTTRGVISSLFANLRAFVSKNQSARSCV